MLHYFSLKVPCYCLDTSKLRSPQLGSHWLLDCLSCSPGNLVGRRTEGSFPKKVKGSQSIVTHFFPLNKQCIDNYCAFSCPRWSKEDILEAEKLLRDLSHFQFIISHGCFGSCFLHGFFSKKDLYWSLKGQTPMVYSHWGLTNSIQLRVWPCWEFCWSWEVHINATERMEVRGNDKKLIFRGKRGWRCFSFTGKTDKRLLYSKYLSISERNISASKCKAFPVNQANHCLTCFTQNIKTKN